MREVKIGVLGAGVVGRGLITSLRQQAERLKSRTGIEFKIIAVFDRSYAKKKEILANIPASDDAAIVVDNPEVEIVVELIGGQDTAGSLVNRALENGKSVVTANKALLARSGREIFALAREKGCSIGFEAAVAGALPVIHTLRRGLVVNDVIALYGILNGTCNFIITRMQQDDMDYDAALKLAQERGFAEADPSFDVNGNDAAQKLALLAGLSFDTFIPEEMIHVEGITAIRKVDLEIVKGMNSVVKLLAIARQLPDGSVQLRVHPAIIADSHALANVLEEKNAIYFETSHSGPVFIMGRGAGSLPTAASVISDLVSIARNGVEPERWMGGENIIRISPQNRYRFYLRFQTQDRPGVLAEIARILAAQGISIATVHQQEGMEPVDVVVITHRADESALLQALHEVDHLPIILNPTVYIRIMEDL